VLSPATLCIHAIRANAADIALLAERGCAVAHCPRSNRAHDHGDAPLAALLAAGVRVGVGTDSVMSLSPLDLLAEARAAATKSRLIKEELGLQLMIAIGDIWRGELELLVRDAGPAEEAFRAAVDFLGERGDRNFYSTAAVGLARALFLQRRYDAAWQALRAAEDAMASDDLITVVWTLGARGRLVALDGRLEEARDACEEGVRRAFETDDLNLQADSLLELAEVVQGTPRATEALGQALQVAENKGNVVVAAQARELLATRQPA
jgi:tetratricopeptide (TPR) repeat protein